MLNLISLREQVYRYLRDQMQQGNLLPGATINLNEISRQLGISKTPLRDALIKLECEGFVSILPRRGVVVRRISLRDIRNAYEIIGALEAAALIAVFDRLEDSHVATMEHLNAQLLDALHRNDFDGYYKLNLDFHNTFLDLSDNGDLRRTIEPMKQRLYDFPRLRYIEAWEVRNCEEHRRFVETLREGDVHGAARFWRDVHWSFTVQEKYIRQFHSNVKDFIRNEMDERQAGGGNAPNGLMR